MVATEKVFAWAVLNVDNFGKQFLVDFQIVRASTLNKMLWLNLAIGTPQWMTYWNFVPTSEVFALAVCNFWKHNYFDRFLNSWCKHFEQHTTNLSLGHFKEQHTGIRCLLVKYSNALAVCYVGNFWETQLLWSTDFRTVGATTLNRTLRIFLWNISKNNIPEFGIFWWSICLGSVLFGQIFVTTISLAVFWIVHASHLLRALDLSLEHPKE